MGMGDDNAAGDVTQPDEMSQTNGVATNESVGPEPDGRSRRLYRQRNRSRRSAWWLKRTSLIQIARGASITNLSNQWVIRSLWLAR